VYNANIYDDDNKDSVSLMFVGLGTYHISLLFWLLFLLRQHSSEEASGSVVLSWIRMKFGRIVV